jgi:hypothetical protein
MNAKHLEQSTGVKIESSILNSTFVHQFTLVGIGFLAFILAVLIVSGLVLILKKCPTVQEKIKTQVKKAFWNPIIKGFQASFITASYAAFVSIEAELSEGKPNFINLISAIVIIALMTSVTIATYVQMYRLTSI